MIKISKNEFIKSFRQVLPKLFSYIFTWVSVAVRPLQSGEKFQNPVGRESKHYCKLAIMNIIINDPHEILAVAQVACAQQA